MDNYLESARQQFSYYKSLGDKTFQQLTDDQLYWQYNEETNSIAIIVKHLVGNMLSRWTNFLTEDGEKPWRHRDTEFEAPYPSKEAMLSAWEQGWQCLFDAINPLTNDDLDRVIYIRNEGHTVVEAINRQLCHYAYHVGQLVHTGKMLKGTAWNSLSIPKNQSDNYNRKKFESKGH